MCDCTRCVARPALAWASERASRTQPTNGLNQGLSGLKQPTEGDLFLKRATAGWLAGAGVTSLKNGQGEGQSSVFAGKEDCAACVAGSRSRMPNASVDLCKLIGLDADESACNTEGQIDERISRESLRVAA